MAPRKTRPFEPPSLADATWLREARLQSVLKVLNGQGGEARIAGGAVRNALLGVPVADIDIATTLMPDIVSHRCRAAGFAVHPTGIDHGTVTVVNQHMPFEVTTLRNDVTTDGRRATVAFTTDWQEDAQRRDFTMNAMYCDANGKVYDFTNGCRDILKRKVRFVGTPSRRIREDFLRILRFFRFHAHFGKGAPDAEGLKACTRLRKGIDSLSAERITQELFKILAAQNPLPVLKVMEQGGILKHCLPGTPNWRLFRRLPPNGIHRLFALNGCSADLGPRFRLSNQQQAHLKDLAEAPDITPAFLPQERRRLLYALGEHSFTDAVVLSLARGKAVSDDPAWRELAELPQHWSAPKFPVTGRDLQAIGLAPGPAMGETLRSLEDWWIASDFKPTRDELLARAKKRT